MGCDCSAPSPTVSALGNWGLNTSGGLGPGWAGKRSAVGCVGGGSGPELPGLISAAVTCGAHPTPCEAG